MGWVACGRVGGWDAVLNWRVGVGMFFEGGAYVAGFGGELKVQQVRLE